MDRRLTPRLAAAAGVALALTGCGGHRERPAAGTTGGWRRLATPADRERLRGWRDSWLAALAQARGQDGGVIARGGVLFQPDRALPRGMPPAGAYRCRTYKLGAQDVFLPGFASHPASACRIEGGRFAKLDGSQRPVGQFHPDGDSRAIFLGTLVLGDERGAMPYGRDANRDMAGIVERIGPQRWRIVLPEPKFESRLDVIELVPAK